MQKIYFEALNEEQKNTLSDLKSFAKYGVLADGTALTLQLGHRRSYDFDIFCGKSISKKFIFKVKAHFQRIQQVLVDTSDEFSFISPAGVKITFLFYPFKHLYPFLATTPIKMLFWKDIALDKAHTIGRRGQWRDYVDLYFVIKNGFALKDIILGAKEKFEDLFSEKNFLSQLCYLKDITEFSVEFTKQKITPSQLQKFFEKEISKMKI